MPATLAADARTLPMNNPACEVGLVTYSTSVVAIEIVAPVPPIIVNDFSAVDRVRIEVGETVAEKVTTMPPPEPVASAAWPVPVGCTTGVPPKKLILSPRGSSGDDTGWPRTTPSVRPSESWRTSTMCALLYAVPDRRVARLR